MEIALLGPLQVDGDGASFSPRDRVVLAALAVRPGEVVPAGRLADALWGETPPASWAKVVQGCVLRVRKALGPSAVETSPGGYRLVVAGHDVDVHRFEDLIERGRTLAATGEPERAASTFARALALWRGPPFEDLGEWSPGRAEATRLEEQRRSVEEDLLDARLEAGEHREVAAEGEVRVTEEPLRERRWALLALAQYRGGRQADALRSLARARRTLAEQLGVDPGPELVALEGAVLGQDADLLAAPVPRAVSDQCPYKGLAPYDVGDTESFFGREAEVAACLQRLGASRLLVVAGSSGCGKTSLVRAGLVPALQRRGRSAVVLVPGADPGGALSSALAGADDDGDRDGGAVLVVDQFEELFALDDATGTRASGAATEFCGRLAAHATERAPVVVVVRADHVAGLTCDVELARLAEQGLHLVSPLAGDALRAAIEGPATQTGLRLEHGLVDLLARDTEGEPGALPLLSHALVETWRRRDGRVLTVEGYRATGGIRGAVARSADRLYESLPLDQRPIVRSVLLRLVAPTSEGDPVRSRVPTRTLGGDPARDRVIGLLVRSRLVTAHEETVELAHEALARAWPRLTNWLDEDAAGQRILRHVAAAADGWDALGRPDSELYRGARLEATLEWRAATQPHLTALEAEFLDAARSQVASEREALAERARHQAHQNRRLRGSLVAVAVFLVMALVAGVVAFGRADEARHQRDSARAAQLAEQHEALVERSLTLRQTDRGVAALLAVEAYRRQPDARAWSALLGTFTATPNFAGYQYLPDAGVVYGAVVPGTSQAVVALDGRDLVLVDLATGEIDHRFPPAAGASGSYAELDVSADGRFVAHAAPSGACDFDFEDQVEVSDGRGCQTLSVHEIASGHRDFGPLSLPFGPDVALNPGGSLVAVAGGYTGKAAVYRVADGRLLRTFPGLERPAESVNYRDTASVGFGPDGRLFLGSMAGPIRVIDPTSLDVVDTYDAPPFSSHNHMIVTADGLLVGGGDHGLVTVDTTTGTNRWAVDIQSPTHPEQCPWLAVAPEVDRLYCGNYFGQMEERDLATGQRTGLRFDPQLGSVGNLAVTSDGRELVAFASQAPVISHWRLDGSGPMTRLVAEGRFVSQGYDPSGRALIVGNSADVTAASDNLDPAVWDPVADELIDPLDLPLRAANWLRSDLLGIVFQDARVGTYDLDKRTASEVSDQEPFEGVDSGTLAADGDRLYLSFDQSRGNERHGEIRTIDPADGSRVDPTIEVDGRVTSLSTTADGSRLAVTVDGARTTIHDARTGDVVAGPLEVYGSTIISPDDVLVLAGNAGDILEYDIDTLEPIATLPRARGRIDILQFSTDGNVLAAMSADQSVSLYDVPTRTRLGDPLPAAGVSSTSGTAEGFLRPDGTNVAINTRLGISLWDIDPAHLANTACTLAGRNLTHTEWATYLSGLGPYRATCPDLPTLPEAPGLIEPRG